VIAFFVYPPLERKKGVVHLVLDFRDFLTGEAADKTALPPRTQAYLGLLTKGKEPRKVRIVLE
jgi:hypothetical protein